MLESSYSVGEGGTRYDVEEYNEPEHNNYY